MKKIQIKLIFRILLLLIGTLSLISVAFLSLVANPTIGFTLQAIISAAMMLYAMFFNKISRRLHILLGLLCVLPITFALFLLVYGNIDNVSYNEDVVIVLGAGVNGERVSRPLAHRLNTAIAYWEQNTDAYIIVCGGLGNRAIITEAEAMARYLIARGVPSTRILLEERSTSTYENLVFAKEILESHFPDGFSALLITNDFHIYRAVHTARYVGLDVGHIGAYTDWYTWPINYLREILAVINFWFF